MWVATNRVIYACPWRAADCLHEEISVGLGTNKIWCGWTTNDTNNTVANVAIDNNRITRLLTDMNYGTTVIQCGQTIFKSNDYLRVNDEILRVASTNANGSYTVERNKGRDRLTGHGSNSVIYAISPLLRKNLIDADNVASRIAAAREQLRQGMNLNPNSNWFVPVPVLFNDGVILDEIVYPQGVFAATTSNLANCLVVSNSLVYYPDPGSQTFRGYFQAVVPGATPVNVWEHYHCKGGEIHCGTAAVRSIPANPSWWEHNLIKNEWRDEK